MFGLRAKLPVSDEERLWVEEGFRRLSRMLDSSRLQNAPVVLPTDEFFPDVCQPDERGLRAIFHRVSGYMHVDPRRLDLEVIPDSSEMLSMLPAYVYSPKGPAGLHFSASGDAARRFQQYQDDHRRGWWGNRLGHLPEEVFAYALARCAKDRGETPPPWIVHLSTNLKVCFRKSAGWLEREVRPID
jgi:hypothetical protein